jgi:hypothetical protein
MSEERIPDDWKENEHGEYERITVRGEKMVTVWRGLGGYWRFKPAWGKCSEACYTRDEAMGKATEAYP